MGRIILRDGAVKRTIPVDGIAGDIEIDLTDEPNVTVPPEVEVHRGEAVPK